MNEQLREWRQRRSLSQLDLALEADISARHLSFLETGRAKPSRDMLLHLADRLDVPLRDRNMLLLGAGFAPAYSQIAYDDDAFTEMRATIEHLLSAHHPFPALAVDRHWNMLASNKSIGILIRGVDPELLKPPINVLRLSLHPNGMAPRILNLPQWRAHILERLRHQHIATADAKLSELGEELAGYAPQNAAVSYTQFSCGILVPLCLTTDIGTLSLLSTTTVFGAPHDVTLAEIALETFLPGDIETATVLRSMA